MKNFVSFCFLGLFFSLFSCNSRLEDKSQKFLGTWTREEKLHPLRYYITTYKIKKNGEGYKVDVLVECHDCLTIPPRTYSLSGYFNEQQKTFNLQRNGMEETLMYDEASGNLISNNQPKFQFSRIKSGREKMMEATADDIGPAMRAKRPMDK